MEAIIDRNKVNFDTNGKMSGDEKAELHETFAAVSIYI